MTAIHVTERGSGERAVFVHGSGSWATHDAFGFGAQLPLAEDFRIVLPDRRGYGGSPDVERSDYAQDAEDIAELLDGGAHLVGHSSGGVVALLAATRAPDSVLSLTLIEPACFQVAADAPLVAAALERNRAAVASVPPDLSDADLVRLNFESVGFEAPEPTPELARATRTALNEFPAWEAQIPLDRLGAFPKLVITGTWENAPQAYREHGGEPIMQCAAVTAERIGADLLRVDGASHWPHSQRADVVNAALREFWKAGALRG
ncbi:Pimeloyl-ACP methyl ester carboxylesterase [Saccharopolyspora antimicrobica]|uniref:Pimeloyl-ACP methyl ester carboxylesterase n=1 Tax=Saccharopolyspora antimicrobica TaxID=455193 RepID=A0A1I4TCF1_9PSEU|nr:alpha/beta hydrolase [Saccharopolyspora antimicrobica]RKT85771.1 pimeloyl-ACP methyl ester carboxylesterase [Saccharopolyspora antimicrobica]SFM74414.1 Pimeloyl-ACP methyl ester carboxylesterase [Saccharopolyspora antimicrobica]